MISNLADLEHPHESVSARDRKQLVVVREIHGVDLSGQIIYTAERLVVVALVEELHFVSVAPSCQDYIIIFLAELAGI